MFTDKQAVACSELAVYTKFCTPSTKVRYRGLRKNTQQLHTLFALANLWMVRCRLLVNSLSKPVMTA